MIFSYFEGLLGDTFIQCFFTKVFSSLIMSSILSSSLMRSIFIVTKHLAWWGLIHKFLFLIILTFTCCSPAWIAHLVAHWLCKLQVGNLNPGKENLFPGFHRYFTLCQAYLWPSGGQVPTGKIQLKNAKESQCHLN